MRKRLVLVLMLLLTIGQNAFGQKRYDPGASDTEIRIGGTAPYSGPASGWGTTGRAQAAYFAKINAEGGINGRKIKLISLDDGYNPTRTVEQTRRLVEKDQVLLIFGSIGSPTNAAVQKYLNRKKVPQLFLGVGDSKFGDPKRYPWTMGFQQTAYSEGRLAAKYLQLNHPNAKIGVIYVYDGWGKELLAGLKDALAGNAGVEIVKEVSYHLDDPTVDSQVVSLYGTRADVLVNLAMPKAAAQVIRKVHDLNWKPAHFINYVSSSPADVLRAAGFDKSIGLISVDNMKDPSDKQWENDAALKEWLAWMKQYYPAGDVTDTANVYGYNQAQTLVHVLRQCGDDLTRENVMRQAASIKNLQLPMVIPGVKINTSATDYYPIEQLRFQRFDGERWVPFGDVISP